MTTLDKTKKSLNGLRSPIHWLSVHLFWHHSSCIYHLMIPETKWKWSTTFLSLLSSLSSPLCSLLINVRAKTWVIARDLVIIPISETKTRLESSLWRMCINQVHTTKYSRTSMRGKALGTQETTHMLQKTPTQNKKTQNKTVGNKGHGSSSHSKNAVPTY